MKPAPRNLSRRNFLLAAGAGGAVATAALMNQRRNDAALAGSKKTAGSTGYHVTEHIRNYYRTAKV